MHENIRNQVTLIIPTFNGGSRFRECLKQVMMQSVAIRDIIVIDSGSSDQTVTIAEQYGVIVKKIAKEDFGHGRTRQYALSFVTTKYAIFMTQDAVLASADSIQYIMDFIETHEKVVAVYGRQISEEYKNPLAKFNRLYNYRETSFVNSLSDKAEKGIKATFFSNSFAIYDVEVLKRIGGFPLHVTFGEDMYVAAKLLLSGYQTGYCAQAIVYHAHENTLVEDFRRCKDIGYFHKSEKWLLDTFGKAEGEGIKFVLSEMKYLWNTGKQTYIPIAFFHNIIKYIGYTWGGS